MQILLRPRTSSYRTQGPAWQRDAVFLRQLGASLPGDAHFQPTGPTPDDADVRRRRPPDTRSDPTPPFLRGHRPVRHASRHLQPTR